MRTCGSTECRRGERKRQLEAYHFFAALPGQGVSIFNVYAFVQNIIISFTNKKSLGQAKFVGLSNYVKLLADAKFYQAIQNTLLYVVICVPAVIILSLIIAVALNQKIKGMGIYRTLDLPSGHHTAYCSGNAVEVAV